MSVILLIIFLALIVINISTLPERVPRNKNLRSKRFIDEDEDVVGPFTMWYALNIDDGDDDALCE